MSSARTYSSRKRQIPRALSPPPPSSSPRSDPSSPPAATPATSGTRLGKRPLADISSLKDNSSIFPPLKRFKGLPLSSSEQRKNTAGFPPYTYIPKKKEDKKNSKSIVKQKTLTQLHFCIDQTILRTCALCDLTYTKGAPDDEALHRAHCTRVRQGMEWGREEEKDRIRGGENIVAEVANDVKLKVGKRKGRIVCIPADVNGKLGAKITTLLRTINLALSSPDMQAEALRNSKVYLFLLPHETNLQRERIVGCVVAQHISTAMAIVPSLPASPQSTSPNPATLISVDASSNLFCDPTPLDTPMGIPRLFVSSSHRRLGIAHSLLTAAAKTFIHGCPVDPKKGQVAFTQPTNSGQAVMCAWGEGGVRIYEE
ncbi:hypothetical protein B0H34DRAFT_789535 [Crassisporium funariophilum]|nr:hypothetical protein B0H34DRAFT_789535 [Crassisporium funariophilum]